MSRVPTPPHFDMSPDIGMVITKVHAAICGASVLACCVFVCTRCAVMRVCMCEYMCLWGLRSCGIVCCMVHRSAVLTTAPGDPAPLLAPQVHWAGCGDSHYFQQYHKDLTHVADVAALRVCGALHTPSPLCHCQSRKGVGVGRGGGGYLQCPLCA
jgi:hypothetical protein